MSTKNIPLQQQLSESMIAMLLFDLNMSYVMAMKNQRMKQTIKQTFNIYEKQGKSLWNLLIKDLKKNGQEAIFDDFIIELDTLLRLYLQATDRHKLLALMDAFNKGEVSVINE
jgi:hypothetical protein